MADFRGERRCNATRESTTDPDAKLMRKDPGKEAPLSFRGRAPVKNRDGLCLDIRVASAVEPEPQVARQVLAPQRQKQRRIHPSTLGADKGSEDFVSPQRERDIAPHIAAIEGRNTPGRAGRTRRPAGYRFGKRIEEILGSMKTHGGLAKTRFRDIERVQRHASLGGAAYHLLCLSRLMAATAQLRPARPKMRSKRRKTRNWSGNIARDRTFESELVARVVESRRSASGCQR